MKAANDLLACPGEASQSPQCRRELWEKLVISFGNMLTAPSEGGMLARRGEDSIFSAFVRCLPQVGEARERCVPV